MNETEKTRSPAAEAISEPIDLREELKKALADEFGTALQPRTALSQAQRTALVEAVATGQVSAQSLLKIFTSAEG